MKPIRGIVLGKNAGKLIVEASDEDVAQFAAHDAIALAKGLLPQDGLDGMLYNRDGKPVAVVTSFEVKADRYDVTTFSDATPQYLNGTVRANATIAVIDPVAMRDSFYASVK